VGVNPLRQKNGGGDEEELGRLVTEATFVTGKLIGNFADLKVGRQVPLILLVQLLWRQGRRLRSEKIK
jgi:hypothetical protein